MAEYCLGYLLAHELRLLWRSRQQQDRQWRDEPSGRLGGKTLGVMGTGSIGAHIARSAGCLGLQVLGYSRSGAAVSGFNEVFPQQSLHDFLSRSDYVVAVVPDTPETLGLMNARSFAAMKSSALFINIGRGNLVDEPALAAALQSGQIAAAVLDVFRREPLPPESPLWTAPNLLITAHVAARSWPADSAGIFLDNFRRFQRQQELKFVVDRERGY
jgi:phosphoglycerate dehydrogenase-like enzyme